MKWRSWLPIHNSQDWGRSASAAGGNHPDCGKILTVFEPRTHIWMMHFFYPTSSPTPSYRGDMAH
jgi:hypothetical protein